MNRRFLSLAAVAMLLAPQTTVFAATLSDVAGTPYNEAFAYLGQAGIVHGYSDGTGRPNQSINRAEALKVLMSMQSSTAQRVKILSQTMPPLPLFSDIDQQSWYASYLEAAFENEIVTGYPDGSFRPAQPVAVEEAIAMLMRSYGIAGETSPALLSDSIMNTAGQWYTPYINAAIERNLLMQGHRLIPGYAISRGQFFDIVYRMHVVMRSGRKAFAGTEPVAPTPVAGGTPIHVNSGSAAADSPYASEKYFAISMPSLGIQDIAINHPEDPFTKDGILSPLVSGLGHLFSYPGRGGKIMVYGHSSGYPWDVSEYTKVFRRINELSEGDKIYVTFDGKLYVYEVAFEQTVDASDTSPFNDNGTGEELILYTCWPRDSIAQRYLVHAVPVETVALR